MRIGNDWKSVGMKILLPALLLIAWELASKTGLVSHLFLPPASEVINRLIELTLNGIIPYHIMISMERIGAGFILSVIVAIPLGILIGSLKLFEDLLDPLIELFRHLSPIALFPVFILWLGIGFASKAAIIFWVCWIPILLNTIKGVRDVDPLLVKAAKSMGAPSLVLLKEVVLPSCIPWIITGLRISVGSALLALVAAEMIGANSGIGYLVLNSAYTFKSVDMYAAIITIALIGFTLNNFFVILEKRISPWKSVKD